MSNGINAITLRDKARAATEADRREKTARLRQYIKANGGQVKTAQALGVSQPALALWLVYGVPLNRIQAVAQHTGLSKEDLQPFYDWSNLS